MTIAAEAHVCPRCPHPMSLHSPTGCHGIDVASPANEGGDRRCPCTLTPEQTGVANIHPGDLEAVHEHRLIPPIPSGDLIDRPQSPIPDGQGSGPEGSLSLADISSLMHRIHDAKSRIEELELTARMDQSRIEAWLRDATAQDRRLIADAEAQCEVFMRLRLTTLRKSDKKSVSTPWGEITTRELPPEIQRVDEGELFTWAQEHGYTREVPAVEAHEEVDWARLRRDIEPTFLRQEDGELLTVPSLRKTDVDVAGITIRPQQPNVTIRVTPTGGTR